DSLLSYPGKVRFFPKGAEDSGNLLAVTDTGHHRLLLAQISFGEDGWPQVEKTEFVGSGGVGQQDGPFAAASFRRPQGVDRNGQHLYVCDTENYLLRRVDLASRTVSTVAGNGRAHGSPTGKSALHMPLRSPWDCAWVDGGLLLAMAGTHQLWGYFPEENQAFPVVGSGMENHVDGPFEECALAQPSSLHRFGQYVVFADSEVSSIRVADFDQRVVGTIVGQGLFDFGDRDGPLEQALLQHPLGTVFHQGMFFVADTFNNKIKKIDFAAKTCTTLLGDGRPGTLHEPGGIDVAGDFLYIPDTNNHRVIVAKVDGSASRILSFGS
ncbi:MAG: hypothetical protein AB1405_16090, partial [Bdellovibrionota bacterium]